jgi:hypothetical protein
MPDYRVENIAPILNVQNISRSLNFYGGLLSFKSAEWCSADFSGRPDEPFADISVLSL